MGILSEQPLVFTKGEADYRRNLPKALRDTESLRREMHKWPLTTARGGRKGLVSVLDDELGFVD